MKKFHLAPITIIILIIIVFTMIALKDKILKNDTDKIQGEITKTPLMLYLNFDDPANTLRDLSGYGNIIKAEDDIKWKDGYYYFEKGFITLNNNVNSNNEISIGFWIKPSERQNSFIMANGPTDSEPSLYINYDTFERLKFNRGKNSRYTEINSVPLNQWTHVFITNDGAITKLYVNGLLQNTVSQEYSVNENHTMFYIGKGYACTSIHSTFRCSEDFFKGDLDEIRVYNEAISAEEISRIYEDTKNDFI